MIITGTLFSPFSLTENFFKISGGILILLSPDFSEENLNDSFESAAEIFDKSR